MGGEVFVGLKYTLAGVPYEQCSLRSTNIMPWFMAQPDFYTMGASFKELLGRAKRKNRWPLSQLVGSIQPSEYGVILFDFDNKIVFSRQRYNAPGSISLQSDNSDDIEALTRLWDNGMLTSLLDGMTQHEFSKKDTIQLINAQRAGEYRYGFLCAKYKAKGWTFNHESVVGRDVWPDVKAFIKKTGWTSPSWSVKRATGETRLAIIGGGVLVSK